MRHSISGMGGEKAGYLFHFFRALQVIVMLQDLLAQSDKALAKTYTEQM